jgi:hypothetical protein
MSALHPKADMQPCSTLAYLWHVVAARCGHDPAALLHSYAKRTKKADTDVANKIGKLLGGALTD